MKYLQLLLFMAIVSCSTINNNKIQNSIIGNMFKDPIVTISPDPKDPITNNRFQSIINVSHPGGLNHIRVNIGGTNIDIDPEKAKSYTMTNQIDLTSSVGVPVSVISTATRTGKPSTQRYSYIFDLAGASDAPTIALLSPANNSTIGVGNLSVDIAVAHTISKISKVIISSPLADQIYDFPNLPTGTNIRAILPVPVGTGFDFSITAVSGIGVSKTENFSYVVQATPTITEITPDPVDTITITRQPVTVKVLSPVAATVSVYSLGSHYGTQTVNGTGEVASFLVFINQQISPAVGIVPIEIRTSYPGSSVVTNIVNYTVDHSALATGPSITLISPATVPSTPIFLTTTNQIINIFRGQQSAIGVTNLRSRLIRTGLVTTTNTSLPSLTFPLTPMTATAELTNTWDINKYQGSGEQVDYIWEATVVGGNDKAASETITYETPTDFVTINNIRIIDMMVSFDINIINSSARPDRSSHISQILISTNIAHVNNVWLPAAVHGPRGEATFSSNIQIPMSLVEDVLVRISSAKTSGFITTNLYTITGRPSLNAYAFNISPPPSSTIPTGSFPLRFQATASSIIDGIKVKKPSGANIDLGPGTFVYTFDQDFDLGNSAGSKNVTIEITSGGVTQSTNITYTSVARNSQYFISLPRDNQVVTSSTFNFFITNWSGSHTINEASQNITVIGSSTNDLGSFGVDLAPGASARKQITLTPGRNIIKFSTTGVTGTVTPISTNINIYYADLTLD
ncbi:MAG: hypothetical protein ACRC9L_07025 [Brevinema sp.]